MTAVRTLLDSLDDATLDVLGDELHDLVRRLYPVPRSITGNGVRETLRMLGDWIGGDDPARAALRVHEVPSGTQALDWTVPKEWNVREAWLMDPSGRVVADFAARYPERADRLVLLGPTMDARARTIPRQFARLMLDIMREPPTNPVNYLRDLWVAGPRRGFGTLRYSLDDRIEEKLPRIQAPTLVVRGGIDPIAPQPWVEELTDLLPLGRLVVVPGGKARCSTFNMRPPPISTRVPMG